MKIKHKLIFTTAGLSLIIISMFLATLYVANQQKDDGLIINMAGRQRMLSQKMSKEVLLLVSALESGSSTEVLNKQLTGTASLFDESLKLLKDGGITKGAEGKDINVQKSTDEVFIQLKKVEDMWKPFYKAIKKILTPAIDYTSDEFYGLLDEIKSKNISLLKEMNIAVNMMQKELENNVKDLLVAQIIGIAIGIVFIALAIITTFSISKRLASIKYTAAQFSEGDLTKRFLETKTDEIGELARSLNAFIGKLQKIMKDINSDADNLAASSNGLTDVSQQMFSSTDQTANRSNTVSAAAEEMSANMASVSSLSEQMSSNMNSLTETAEQSSNNINTVATATEEMTATIDEIAQNTEKARTITNEAVKIVESASNRVNELGGAAKEINKVIEVIVDIAEQTKLLALNATIEAAGAGEAGKGFAVVASEVKELAKETNAATDDIRKKIEAMQSSTDGTVTDINEITSVIKNVNETVGNIAAAVEEQSITTRDIANNVGQAANRIKDMTDNVNEAATGVDDMSRNVIQASEVSGTIASDISTVNNSNNGMKDLSETVNTRASELTKMADGLKKMVEKFKLAA